MPNVELLPTPMETINSFTPQEIETIRELNARFAARMTSQSGEIQNEDSFEKAGLFEKLRESPEFLAEYKSRAERKIPVRS